MKSIIFAAITTLTTTTFAATSGILTLTGTVDAYYAVSFSNSSSVTTAAATVDIINGESSKLVGTVYETSNNLAGYRIYMSSANASKLVNGSDTSKTVSYTVSYDNVATPALSTVPQQVKYVSSLSGLTTSLGSAVRVSFPGQPNAPAGTYSDTLTISITAP